MDKIPSRMRSDDDAHEGEDLLDPIQIVPPKNTSDMKWENSTNEESEGDEETNWIDVIQVFFYSALCDGVTDSGNKVFERTIRSQDNVRENS